MGSHSYLQNQYSVPHLQMQYRVPHLQNMINAVHIQGEPDYLQNLAYCSGAACNQMQYLAHKDVHFTRAQADAIETRADKADADTHTKLEANTKLTVAQRTKLEAAADALDKKIHDFVEAHVVADPALQQLYCQLNLAHLKDCFWVIYKSSNFV